MFDKRALRGDMRCVRDGFAAGAAPIAVPAPFAARLSPGLTIASYVPIGSEADPSPFARAATEAGCVIALPHVVDRQTPIRFLAWATEAALASGPFGLIQPHGHEAELEPDIILTPLIAFDRGGNRVGQGAGHYDRAFARLPRAWRVGIAWSVQEAQLPTPDAWDMPLHAIATEKDWITP